MMEVQEQRRDDQAGARSSGEETGDGSREEVCDVAKLLACQGPLFTFWRGRKPQIGL